MTNQIEPVVLIHCSGSSGAQWRALAASLSDRYHVLAPDLIGYGGSAPWASRAEFCLAQEAALIRSLIGRLQRPVHLVGHSYGGAVALHIARTRPELLRSLTLVEPSAFHLLRGGDAIDMAGLEEIMASRGGRERLGRDRRSGRRLRPLRRLLERSRQLVRDARREARGVRAAAGQGRARLSRPLQRAGRARGRARHRAADAHAAGRLHQAAVALRRQAPARRAAGSGVQGRPARRSHVADYPPRRGQRPHRCAYRRQRSSDQETDMEMQTARASDRYAKCIEVSKRIRWDIDRDVIRGRAFDFGKKFLPDGLSQGRRARVPVGAGRSAAAEPDPGPHLRQHVRAGRALHRRQDPRGQPRALARRPDRARGAGALHRRGAQAPGAVPPHRGDDRRRHAGRLQRSCRSPTTSPRPCWQVHLGGARR